MATQRPIKSLSELMDGGVEERFNHKMNELWENVQDPNTAPQAKREINIKITIKPNERPLLRGLRGRHRVHAPPGPRRPPDPLRHAAPQLREAARQISGGKNNPPGNHSQGDLCGRLQLFSDPPRLIHGHAGRVGVSTL